MRSRTYYAISPYLPLILNAINLMRQLWIVMCILSSLLLSLACKLSKSNIGYNSVQSANHFIFFYFPSLWLNQLLTYFSQSFNVYVRLCVCDKSATEEGWILGIHCTLSDLKYKTYTPYLIRLKMLIKLVKITYYQQIHPNHLLLPPPSPFYLFIIKEHQ